MTFNDNANVGGNKARRRGRTAAVAGGGVVGLGAIVVVVLNLLGVGDFSALLGGGTGAAPSSQGSGESEIANCETGTDANANDDCRLAAGSLALDQYWAQQIDGYREPKLIIVDGQTSTACGTASNATGPFYCPPEEAVYVDPTFFGILHERFGATAGSLSQLYVLAHEYGHHIQQITGIMDRNPNNGSGPESNGVRTELQADCFAGAWVGAMSKQIDENGVPYLEPPTQAQIEDALNAAATVGDDHIQKSSGAAVNPESWTHGSSEQRIRWFGAGYNEGLGSCDAFAVSGSSL